MGIRVSYTGEDGRQRSFVTIGKTDLLGRIGAGHNQAGLGGVNGFGANADGVRVSGSIKNTIRGIELEGDQRIPVGVSPSVYGRKAGRRGWYTQDELDPKEYGTVIGDPTDNNTEAQMDNRSEHDMSAFRDSSVTRIVMQREIVDDESAEVEEGEEPPKKMQTSLWAFHREHCKTADGREFAVGEERKTFIGFVDGGGVSGSFTKVGGVRFYNYEFQVRIDTVEVRNGSLVTTEGEWTKMEGGDTVAHSTAQY